MKKRIAPCTGCDDLGVPDHTCYCCEQHFCDSCITPLTREYFSGALKATFTWRKLGICEACYRERNDP